jgi:peptidoglycan/xylan/chitin deacetylase (PgdA/CDA1 family)
MDCDVNSSKPPPSLTSTVFRLHFFLVANTDPILIDGWPHPNWSKTDWSEKDIQSFKGMIQRGHEIGSHSVTHSPNKMAIQPDIEARESKRLIEGWVGTNVSSFCYPFYWSHAHFATAVANAGYEQARGGGKPPAYYPPHAPYYSIPDDATLDRFNVGCRQVSVSENKILLTRRYSLNI